MKSVMIKPLNKNSKAKLEKSFYLLTRRLTEIETTFKGHIQSQINTELHEHQQYILSTYKQLDQCKKV